MINKWCKRLLKWSLPILLLICGGLTLNCHPHKTNPTHNQNEYTYQRTSKNIKLQDVYMLTIKNDSL